MIHIEDIHSLTDFTRNTKAYAKQLKKTKRPAILTVNGKAEFVVQEAKSYQEAMGFDLSTEDWIKLRRSIDDAESGRVHNFDTVANKLMKKHFGTKTKGIKKKK
jgi:PHD/YefM family antitoxin component YafN of YafNO toxin-antitoxin module